MAAHDVSQRMTPQRVAAEQKDVEGEHEGADADAELPSASRRIDEPERLVHVVQEDAEKNQRDVEEIPVDVLKHEGERLLAPVGLPRLPDAARGRVRPKGLVVGAAVVVAGKSKEGGKREDAQGGGEG